MASDMPVNLPPDALILLHYRSVGSALGAVLLFILLFYSLVYYLFSRRELVVRDFALVLVPQLLFLSGFGMYASARTVSDVDFWTRICYIGVALVPITFQLLAETVTGRPRSGTTALIAAFSLIGSAGIWLDDRWLITHEIMPYNPADNPTMVKGPAFAYFVVLLFVPLIYSYGLVLRRFIRERSYRHSGWPLVAGFGFWLLNGLNDGLHAAGVAHWGLAPWLGPVVMAMLLSIYLGLRNDEREKALERLVTEKDTLYQQMIRDDLTGLFSRNYLIHILGRELAGLPRSHREHSLLFIDLDDFKQVNDQLGHQVGDQVLQAVGAVLSGVSRQTDVAARFGGDEFLLLLLDCPEAEAITVAQRVQERFTEASTRIAGTFSAGKVSVSIGVSSSRYWAGCQITDVLEQPDRAMYTAKRSGKGRVAVYKGD